MKRLNWLAVAVGVLVVAHVVVFTQLFVSGGFDVELYYGYASNMESGMVPYRDFSVEYPPGALLVFLLPKLFVSSPEAYGTAFTLEMLAFDLACLFMVFLLARRLRLSPLSSVIIYSLAVASVSSISVQRFDFASAAISLAAILAISRGRYKTAWALVAIGTLVKLYPVVLAPLFLIYQWRHQRWRNLIAPVLVFGAVVMAFALPFWLLSPEGFTHAFALQGGRNLQIESSYASVLFMLYSVGRALLSVFQGPVSWDLDSPYSAGIAQVALLVMALAAVAVCISYYLPYRSLTKHEEGPPPAPALGRLINYSLLIIIVLLLTSKVVSTQFMVWLLPFVPLVTGRARSAVWLSFIAVGWLTWYTYPTHYWDLRNLNILPMDVLFLRNVLLGLMALWLWRLKDPEPEASLITEPVPQNQPSAPQG